MCFLRHATCKAVSLSRVNACCGVIAGEHHGQHRLSCETMSEKRVCTYGLSPRRLSRPSAPDIQPDLHDLS